MPVPVTFIQDPDRLVSATMAFLGRPAINGLPMLAVIGVMMSRARTMSSVQAFVPTWYSELGFGAGFYGGRAAAGQPLVGGHPDRRASRRR